MNSNSGHSILQEWVSSYSDDLYRWATHKTNDQESAKDLVQETFLAAYNSFDRFKGNSQPKTWLFSILKNKIMDFHRKKFQTISMNQTLSDRNKDEFNIMGELFDKDGSWKEKVRPSAWNDLEIHLLDNTDFVEILKNCMNELPEIWHSAIQFKYLEDRNAKEICQELEITTSNYWQIIHRAKLQLRTCIENNWFK